MGEPPAITAPKALTHHEHPHDHGTHSHPTLETDPHGHAHADGHSHEHPTGIKGFLYGLFVPHTLDAADSIDDALQASAQGIQAVKISLFMLLDTTILQFIVVLFSGSVALHPATTRPSPMINRTSTTTNKGQPHMDTMDDTVARIPGHGSFTVTADAMAMIRGFGGFLYCHQGKGGCRKQGLYFSRTQPKKFLRCLLSTPSPRPEPDPGLNQDSIEEIILAVSHELAPKLDGAVLDFGNYNKMQRFIWSSMPAATGPRCVCRRSMGTPAGKRSPCLDEQGIGLSDT